MLESNAPQKSLCSLSGTFFQEFPSQSSFCEKHAFLVLFRPSGEVKAQFAVAHPPENLWSEPQWGALSSPPGVGRYCRGRARGALV